MFSTFLSVVLIADTETTPGSLLRDVQGVLAKVQGQFRDLEIIIVQNGARFTLQSALNSLPQAAAAIIHGVQLTKTVSQDVAALAGLDRANGDWAAVLTPLFARQPDLLLQLFSKAQQNGTDLTVIAPAKQLVLSKVMRALQKLWGFQYRMCGVRDMAPGFYCDALLSRRALTTVLRLRHAPVDLALNYTQAGLLIEELPADPAVSLTWREVVAAFGRGWQRLLHATPILHYAIILLNALVFAYAWLTTFTIVYIPPTPYGNNPNADLIKAMHSQDVIQAWIWFTVCLGLAGMYTVWNRLRQLPGDPPYTVMGVQRVSGG